MNDKKNLFKVIPTDPEIDKVVKMAQVLEGLINKNYDFLFWKMLAERFDVDLSYQEYQINQPNAPKLLRLIAMKREVIEHEPE